MTSQQPSQPTPPTPSPPTSQQVPKRKNRWWFYAGVLPLTWGICAWQGWLWWSWAIAPVRPKAETAETETVRVKIPPDTSSQEIGSDLHELGLIRSPLAWKIWTRWMLFSNAKGSYQAGSYNFSTHQSLPEIANAIWQGKIEQQSVTIPEGWSIARMASAFERQKLFSAEAFLQASRRIPRDRYPWLPEGIPHLEGFLFPDTYQLPTEGATPEMLVAAMLDRFEQVALPLYRNSENIEGYTFLEWVTLASIVEEEAVVPRERGTIAGVFARRLEEGIPLAADPTVEYGLGVSQSEERTLTFEEVRTPSPYNTYINPGLTPTPISSPGIGSLQAALQPEKTEYLFFVAKYDGTHIFSRTLAEHEAARDKIWEDRE